jgi:Protein of unknown function (DUF1553)/Protein of unknown function (DUF1549)/Concanavalin A-like lectin/glucanases superfamily/Planctomycete cytochrome C
MKTNWVALALAWPGLAATVEFNRDIRPILSDKCYTCHGPDKANRKSKLRFDNEAGAMADLGGHFAIVPGDPAKSEMIRRITSENKALRMPPVYSGATLSDREIGLIRDWISQGAKWEKHWSFIPPKRPELPRVSKPEWVRNPIDAFVLARLDREGLAPSPEAERAILIRRVSLDLTGIPPTPAEVDAFVRDGNYEKLVDRLLASPRYGERMAARWLDAARYADTNGYQTDGERSMWRWRDWVIDAFNRNMPYDRFTIEQIAGDMLPNATLEQKIASGFNRNHRGNGEGGIVPEEYAVEYVVDRVDTTSTVWLGLTVGCARCHDHKYDPILQKEFYQFFAYFNNVPERGMAFKYGNSPPFIQAPTPAQQSQLRELDQKVASAEAKFAKLDVANAQRKWEQSLDTNGDLQWSIPEDLVAQHGRAEFDGKSFVDAGDVANFGFYDRFTLAAWVFPTSSNGAIVTRMQDTSEPDGFGLYLNNGKVAASMVKRWLDDGGRVETEGSLPLNRWSHVMVTYDGSRLADGIKIYIDGAPQKVRVLLDVINQTFAVKEPLRIGAGGGPESRFRGSIDDVRIYKAALTAGQARVLATRDAITAIAAVDPAKRSQAQSDKIRLCFLDQYAPADIQQAWREMRDVRKERQRFVESLPTVMVMQERPQPRDTFVLVRGAYDKPGEKVTRGTPAVLPPLPSGIPNNRLGLARWLVDLSNPLTARVMVNRLWQMYFGVGIVKTVEDFGSQGEWPTHPELLDWLATEFMRNGWDIKAITKTIVTSATYRQSSSVSPDLEQKDPENRLMARGPRFRMPAEMVRDQALAISGLLVEKIGGPSVKPYQPAGLWKELSGSEDYQQDKGENLYRRSLYTFWKRAVAPPEMLTFDSAGRETCIVRETRTNTPLQALTLMNDITYLEAARVLAQRMMIEGGPTAAARIAFGLRLATARPPSQRKSEVLLGSFQHYLDDYQTNPEAARKLVSVGESPVNQKLNVTELAAYTTVASLILNMDETVTKE